MKEDVICNGSVITVVEKEISKNCIYRFINVHGEIIYIGKAKDLKQRLASHNHLTDKCYSERTKIEYAEFKTEHDMDFAERYYIQKINPKYNTILANRNISFSSLELDNVRWFVYDDEQSTETSTGCSITNKDEILQQMKVLKAKEDVLNELIDEDRDNDILYIKLNEINKEREKLGLKLINKLELNNQSKWLVEEYIKYNVYTPEELIEEKLKVIENEYFKKCKYELETNGYYKLDIYEEIDQCFVCTDGKSETHGSWLHLLKGDFVNSGLLKYKVDFNVKNTAINKIIENIENKLYENFRNMERKVILLKENTHGSYLKAFYGDYEYSKFEKPFIVNSIS